MIELNNNQQDDFVDLGKEEHNQNQNADKQQ